MNAFERSEGWAFYEFRGRRSTYLRIEIEIEIGLDGAPWRSPSCLQIGMLYGAFYEKGTDGITTGLASASRHFACLKEPSKARLLFLQH